MIVNGSRYVADTDFNEGTIVSIAKKSDKYIAKKTMTIVTRHGDTFDKVASRYLNDATQYWKIAGLNPNVRFPDTIPVGTVLVVPVS